MRHLSSGSSDDEASIDMSPLIDVVFILLIFFIVTTVFNNEPGVDVDKPAKVANTKNLDSNAIRLAVTDTGQVYYNGRNIGVSGVRTVVEAIQGDGEKLPVIILGDKNAKHGVMMKVRGACYDAGATKVSEGTLK